MSDTPFGAIGTRLFPGSRLIRSERLTGGVSADVHRLDLRLADGTSCSVVLRSHGETHSGHSAELEFQLLEALQGKNLNVPEPLMVDSSGDLLPDPYLVVDFVEGSSRIPETQAPAYIAKMAAMLARIHAADTSDLPHIPMHLDPLPEVFDFLPEGREWSELRAFLETLENTGYMGPVSLLHGDFWAENLLWRDGVITAVLDWEDGSLGDPLLDVAAARVELRYRYGQAGMLWFTDAYSEFNRVDPVRLALWQIYVAAAAQKFMGLWRLDAARESHMRNEALASIREAGVLLMGC